MKKGFHKAGNCPTEAGVTIQEPQNCWEFWNCPEELKIECSAYLCNLGNKCWLVSGFSKKNKTARKDIDCTDCEWYKKLNH